jgi:hypothetical protein
MNNSETNKVTSWRKAVLFLKAENSFCGCVNCKRQYTVKKVWRFPVPCRDVTNQSLPGRELTSYAPMIYTAPCVMFLMRADTLRGQLGGCWALEMESFLGPVKWYRAGQGEFGQ